MRTVNKTRLGEPAAFSVIAPSGADDLRARKVHSGLARLGLKSGNSDRQAFDAVCTTETINRNLAQRIVLRMQRLTLFVLLGFALVLSQPVLAQSSFCASQGGTLGPNLFLNDGNFGTGSSTPGTTGSALPAGHTTYSFAPYNVSSPNDGSYSIVNRLNLATFDYWFDDVVGHTTGATEDQMMVINADFTPGIFYEETVTVTPNSDYQFSAHFLNLPDPSRTGWSSYPSTPGVPNDPTQPGGNVEPNISFYVQRAGVDASPVLILTTGDLAFFSSPTWQEYGTVFNSGASTGVTVYYQNNAPGGVGNDFAMDDVFLAGCELPEVVSSDDSGNVLSGIAATAVADVTDNDTIDGGAIDLDPTTGNATISELGSWPTGYSLDTATGAVIYDGTPMAVGNYTMDYQLCHHGSSTNCDSATVAVTVAVPEIVANADDYSGTPADGLAGDSLGSVLANDTLNGAAVATDGAQTTLTITDADGITGLTLDDDGTLNIPSGTAAGSHTVTYQLCDELNPTNCDSATVSIQIDNTSLLALIESELTSLLRDDLAVTLTAQSGRMNDYASGALERLKSRDGQQCAAAATLVARDINFDTDKAIIKPGSNRILDEIASILSSCSGSRFEIGGHTDARGSDAYNIDLSQRRVDAVLRALATRGVDTTGFVTRGYGERRPVATNATAEGMAKNRRVTFTLIEDAERLAGPCSSGDGPRQNFDLSANDAGVTIEGDLLHESYDCVNDRWSIVEGALRYIETDNGIAQGSFNLSYRKEGFVTADTVRGYFLGIYASQSDVDSSATGTIDGMGVNAGLYGAQRLNSGLFLDYYLGAAAGLHRFDLDFEDSLGTIAASGDYLYLAGFGGAAISGELTFGDYTLSPRAGFDVAYSPGGDVDVETALLGVTQSGTLELEEMSGGAIFAELRTERTFDAGSGLIALTPRVACYQSLGSRDGDCGVGATLEIASIDAADDLSYAIEIGGERGASFTSGTIRAQVSRRIGLGRFRAQSEVSMNSGPRFGGSFEMRF